MMADRIKPSHLIGMAEEIDNRLGPIPGHVADRIAVELRAAAQEIRHLRAVNAELLAALDQIAQERDAGRHDGLLEPCPALDADTMWAIARAALSESDGAKSGYSEAV
jgi:hypothetical protein